MSRTKSIDSIYDVNLCEYTVYELVLQSILNFILKKKVTVAYRGGKMPVTELDFLKGNLPHEIHFYTDKFDSNSLFKTIDINENVNDLSTDLTENKKKILEEWVHQRWTVKEEFLKR